MDELSLQDHEEPNRNLLGVATKQEFPNRLHVFSSELTKQFDFAFDLALQNSRKDYYLLNKHYAKSSSQETYYTSTSNIPRITKAEHELINSMKSLKLNRKKNKNHFDPYKRRDSPIPKRKEYKNIEDQLNSMRISSVPQMISIEEKYQMMDAELPEPYLQALSDDLTTLSLA